MIRFSPAFFRKFSNLRDWNATIQQTKEDRLLLQIPKKDISRELRKILPGARANGITVEKTAGEPGSGKTTLIEILAKLEKATGIGESLVLISTSDLIEAHLKEGTEIGRMFEESNAAAKKHSGGKTVRELGFLQPDEPMLLAVSLEIIKYVNAGYTRIAIDSMRNKEQFDWLKDLKLQIRTFRFKLTRAECLFRVKLRQRMGKIRDDDAVAGDRYDRHKKQIDRIVELALAAYGEGSVKMIETRQSMIPKIKEVAKFMLYSEARRDRFDEILADNDHEVTKEINRMESEEAALRLELASEAAVAA